MEGLSCAQPVELTCGSVVTGTTIGGANDLAELPCSAFATTGPENWMTFTSTEEQFVTITLSGLAGDLDLGVGDMTCGAGTCQASTNNGLADESVFLSLAAGEVVEVVADGFGGDASDFTMTTACTPMGACSEDLFEENDVSVESAGLGYVATGDIEVVGPLAALDTDWYFIDVDLVASPQIEITYDNAFGELQAITYDNTLAPTDSAVGQNGVLTVEATSTFAGLVYLEVIPPTGAGCISYVMEISG